MKLSLLLTINAVVFIAIGIAFALYGPLMIAAFGAADLQEGNSHVYWYVVSFARMFGAALFGYGFLIWAVRDLFQEEESQEKPRISVVQRGVLLSLILADAVSLLVTLVQQVSIWVTPVGWSLVALFVILLVSYGIYLGRGTAKQPESPGV